MQLCNGAAIMDTGARFSKVNHVFLYNIIYIYNIYI